MMSDLSDLSDLSDICAAEISRAGKKSRSQYPWVKYRGALQYRQGMTAFPPPPAGQGGVMMLVHNRPPPPRVIRPDRLYKTCAALPVRYNSFCAAMG